MERTQEAFGNEGQLFGDISMEEFVKPFTATLQFVGVTALPTFAFYDVFKNPNIETDLLNYKEHLKQYQII